MILSDTNVYIIAISPQLTSIHMDWDGSHEDKGPGVQIPAKTPEEGKHRKGGEKNRREEEARE